MSVEDARRQSLAACGAAVFAFIGVCHEGIGAVVFPWGPAFFGGPIGWHAAGVFCIVAGIAVLAGTLRAIAFPVVPFALLAIVLGVAMTIFTGVAHHQFHMFAVAAAGSGAVTAYFHR